MTYIHVVFLFFMVLVSHTLGKNTSRQLECVHYGCNPLKLHQSFANGKTLTTQTKYRNKGVIERKSTWGESDLDSAEETEKPLRNLDSQPDEPPFIFQQGKPLGYQPPKPFGYPQHQQFVYQLSPQFGYQKMPSLGASGQHPPYFGNQQQVSYGRPFFYGSQKPFGKIWPNSYGLSSDVPNQLRQVGENCNAGPYTFCRQELPLFQLKS